MLPEALLWNLDETARQLGNVHPRTVRRLIDRGELPAVRIGRCIRVPAAAVRGWIEQKISRAHNPSGARQAVATTGVQTLCQNAKSEIKTVSLPGRIPHSGGPVTPMDAANRLGSLLGFDATPIPGKNRPKRFAPNGS